MRKIKFVEGEFYHVYNRGVEKRNIFLKEGDYLRFLQSVNEFNTLEPIGSLHENSFLKESEENFNLKDPLVNFIAYYLNPNHFHFIITPVKENGIEKFMHRLGTGYTRYFNDTYKRTGGLFQGTYKAKHVDSNEYLLHLSSYVNLNDKVHQLGGLASKLEFSDIRSSREQYFGGKENSSIVCVTDIVLSQFKNKQEYKKFAIDSLKDILERKTEQKELLSMLLE